uniref:H or Na translocating Ftype putative n=1 Tax=Albugo laibachii Nc14 TaxID=890382 RepID=F0WR85_9STRA|nr:H or Na translocating Ftype putative [Albugo laibachii Nc14]|eukprot:CCA23846.1 H or Na translocating Ftype putative [Albugo laibachii Nc14]
MRPNCFHRIESVCGAWRSSKSTRPPALLASKRFFVKDASIERTNFLTQQLLDRIQSDQNDSEEAITNEAEGDFASAWKSRQTPNSSKQMSFTLRCSGTIVDVRECVAIVSGLRDACVGSLVAIISDLNEKSKIDWYGVVLYMEKRSAHIALIPSPPESNDTKSVPVSIGMQAQVVSGRLALDPTKHQSFHYVRDLITISKDSDNENSLSASLPFLMGSKCVPKFMSRRPLQTPFRTDIVAIDCFQPLALGHRIGVFGPLHSGKSELMLEIIINHINGSRARNLPPPHFVYVCIGQSAHRLRRISQALQTANVSKHATVVATSNYDALVLQYLTPFVGCVIAERHDSPQTVIVYDDLATHSTIAEQLIRLIMLPGPALNMFDGLAMLMERSGQFPEERSMTTFALAKTEGETAEMHERLRSLVDDTVSVPNDVTLPGKSIRGVPFQCKGLWRWNHRLRARMNRVARKAANMEEARQLGIEHDTSYVVEYQQLVKEFFAEKVVMQRERILLGVLFLAVVDMDRLPSPFHLASFLDKTTTKLIHSKDLGQQLEIALTAGDWPTTFDGLLIAFLHQQMSENE